MNSFVQTRIQFKDFTKAFLMSIGLYAIFGSLISYTPGLADFFAHLHPSVSFTIQYAVQFVILFFPLWFFVLSPYSMGWKDLGFQKIAPWLLLKNTLKFYGLYIVLALIITLLISFTGVYIPGYESQESYLPFFGTDTLGIATAILFVVFVGPFLEEIFFRGFIYRVFLKVWPRWMASFLSAFVFGLFHLQFQVILPLILIGLILNAAYHRSGSLWVAYGVHALNNAVAFSFMLLLNQNPELLEQVSAFLYNCSTALH